MVDEITPDYYASGVQLQDYGLRGRGFWNIPSDAVGILARDNSLPLEFKNLESPNALYDINVFSNDYMVATPQSSADREVQTYLGGIVSRDRQTVYWVNDSAPLP